MKNLKIIFSSLLTMAFIAVLTTSCNRTDLITEEFSETNVSVLAKKLADNPNFQSSINSHEQIGNDLMGSVRDNSINITDDGTAITSYNSSYSISEGESAMFKANLLTDMPELNSISEQAFGDALSEALNLLGKQALNSRNCASQYNNCMYYNAYIPYFYGTISYNSYIAAYYACVQQYYACI